MYLKCLLSGQVQLTAAANNQLAANNPRSPHRTDTGNKHSKLLMESAQCPNTDTQINILRNHAFLHIQVVVEGAQNNHLILLQK